VELFDYSVITASADEAVIGLVEIGRGGEFGPGNVSERVEVEAVDPFGGKPTDEGDHQEQENGAGRSFETQHGGSNEASGVAIMGRGRKSGTGLYLVLTLSKLRKMQAGGFCALSYQEGRRWEGNKKNKKLLHSGGAGALAEAATDMHLSRPFYHSS
jgi:hypothetical protein